MKKHMTLAIGLGLALTLTAAPVMAETFSASSPGFGGDVTVTLEVEDGTVTDVQIEGAAETPDLGGAAMPVMAQEILEGQTPYVDGYSGASLTSTAILTAAQAAFEAAGISVEPPALEQGDRGRERRRI